MSKETETQKTEQQKCTQCAQLANSVIAFLRAKAEDDGEATLVLATAMVSMVRMQQTTLAGRDPNKTGIDLSFGYMNNLRDQMERIAAQPMNNLQ
jgi:hypothetical protein